MNLIALLMILITLSTDCFASQFEGLITTYKSKRAIIVGQTNSKIFITYKNNEIAQQVSKLKTNDFISFDGLLNANANSVEINSLNFVGLRELIGAWSSDDIYCYEFNNFTDMAIYIRNRDFKCGSKNPILTSKKKFLTYTINPTSSGWLILISGDSASYAGDLAIKSLKRVDLSLYDSETGDILRKIILRK